MNRGGEPQARESGGETKGKRGERVQMRDDVRQKSRKGTLLERTGEGPSRSGGGGTGLRCTFKVAKATALARARRIDVSSRALIGCG